MYYYNISELPHLESIKGIRIKEVSLDNVMMTFMEFDIGVGIPAHQHSNEQITLVIKGKAMFHVGGCEKVLVAGDVCAIPENIEHSVNILEDKTVMYDCWYPIRSEYIVSK